MKALGPLLTALFVLWSVQAQSADPPRRYQITYGISPDGKEPKAGSIYCSDDENCTLIDDADVHLNLELSTSPRGGAIRLMSSG